MAKRLTGKIAIVTRCSKGIGASIAQHLAEEGAFVTVNYSTSKEGADASHSHMPHTAVYSASKAAVDAITRQESYLLQMDITKNH